MSTKMRESFDNSQFIIDEKQNQDSTNPYIDDDENDKVSIESGRLRELKQREKELLQLLMMLKQEKDRELGRKPLNIGIVGFGNFGQFVGKTFVKHAELHAMNLEDTSKEASEIGATFTPIAKPEGFFDPLDVVVFMVSIKSFEIALKGLLPEIERDQQRRKEKGISGPLFVDVLSVKEYPRKVMLDLLPKSCDILCTHPMFGPISGANGWMNLKFIYEKTRLNGKILVDETRKGGVRRSRGTVLEHVHQFIGKLNRESSSVELADQEEKEGMDRMERFLSIWEEEGCQMEEMTCKDHDMFAAKSQFITHLIGRILGRQDLHPTPVDTKGFESVLALTHSTNSDSFDLFYGLYKYNNYALDTIFGISRGLNEVVEDLRKMEREYF